jgi:hypothetical protein
MAKSTKESTKSREDEYRARRMRTARIFFVVFTIIIVLSWSCRS